MALDGGVSGQPEAAAALRVGRHLRYTLIGEHVGPHCRYSLFTEEKNPMPLPHHAAHSLIAIPTHLKYQERSKFLSSLLC